MWLYKVYCMMVFTWPLQIQTRLSWMKYDFNDFNIKPNNRFCFPSSHKSYIAYICMYLYKDAHVYIQYVSEILESFSD